MVSRTCSFEKKKRIVHHPFIEPGIMVESGKGDLLSEKENYRTRQKCESQMYVEYFAMETTVKGTSNSACFQVLNRDWKHFHLHLQGTGSRSSGQGKE